ncbi:hypothetical protein SAMN04487970_106124 [Paenibacillus tianmuensis]|uniref:Uncharacterized protein n=1 Tax=Paenibacillus tianmuensis TaxID=624147 RepID=A0A1G4TS46_9BACL|nr:hypothetical protein [Paenibacillus tianmuensis]SCW83429.1 hypothetical protein SAMN04487970_106124 [Paenibacillus tianmuensis]
MIKKRQYYIWQYSLDHIKSDGTTFSLDYNLESATLATETLMYYILNEKIMKRKYEPIIEYQTNKDGSLVKSISGTPIKIKKNVLPIITIETGRDRSAKTNEKLSKLLNEGFTANYHDSKGNNISVQKFVFLDNVLSSSQNKECRQIFIWDKYVDQLKRHISLGTEPTKCTVSKNLTRNALTTTDVYLFPVDMKELTICIIPDKEVPVIEDVEMIKPYHRSPEEESRFAELQAFIATEKEYDKQRLMILGKVKEKEIELPIAPNSRDKKYKTVGQWRKEGRRVRLDALIDPQWKVTKKDGTHVPVWTFEQTEPYEEKEFPITEWSTGLQLAEVKAHKVMENVFDGMGLVCKELGQRMEQFLQSDFPITGYQLRLPSIKGFFPCVDFRRYFRKHRVNKIKDIFNEWHETEKIDILATESTFKAKLEVVGKKPDASEDKRWLFPSISDYKSKLLDYGYDVIGISNVAKPVHETYRKSSYQLLLALNVRLQDIFCFSNVLGDMIHRTLSIYRKEETDWNDIAYVEAFLNQVFKENSDNNLGKNCSDAVKAIHLNKKLVFDHKVMQTIKDVIDHKIDEMCLGKFYLKAKYLYVTQDILAFLSYAAAEDKNEWMYTGFLGPKQCYCGGSIKGQRILARNPIMSFSELTRTTFVDYENEDVEFIRHLTNIVQLPLGTEPDRLGGADRDGDELLVLDTDTNWADTSIEYMQNYNDIVQDTGSEDYGNNRLELFNERLKLYFNERFPSQSSVTLRDYVINSLVQINDADKSTAESEEWTKRNIIDFIIRSEDKTGKITDINTTIENIANSEQDLVKYKLPIAIMKHLQALCIDASKSGLFDKVVIPDVIQYQFGKWKPQFMKFKDGNDYNKDKKHTSALDSFSHVMAKFKKYIHRIMIEETDRKVQRHKFENIYRFFQNPNLDTTYVDQTIAALQDTYASFLQKNRTLTKQKLSLNQYSSDEKHKRLRKEIDEKFAELFKETREQAGQICDCPSLLATASVRMTYVDSKAKNENQNYSFCWVVASEGILQNIQLNYEDLDKLYIQSANRDDSNAFEWLGEYYCAVTKHEAYALEFPEGKDMSIPEKYLKKQDRALVDLIDYEVTLLSSEKKPWEPKIVAEKIVDNTYTIFDDHGWLGVAEGLSIARKKGDTMLDNFLGSQITIKTIVNTTNASITCVVDMKC